VDGSHAKVCSARVVGQPEFEQAAKPAEIAIDPSKFPNPLEINDTPDVVALR
jgi:hypothetical protein